MSGAGAAGAAGVHSQHPPWEFCDSALALLPVLRYPQSIEQLLLNGLKLSF